MREASVIVTASAKREARQAWLTAQYTRFAYHQPNDMPDDPAVEEVRPCLDPKVAAEIERIRLRVKLRADAKGAKHGR